MLCCWTGQSFSIISYNVLLARFTIAGLYFVRILFFWSRLNIVIFFSPVYSNWCLDGIKVVN